MRSAIHFPHFPIPAAKARHLGSKAPETRRPRFEVLEPRALLSGAALFQTVGASSPADSATVIPPLVGLGEPMGSAVPPGGALSPQQIRAAYGIDLLSADGAGQTIAIVDAYDNPNFLSSSDPNYATSDLHNFNAYYGLPDFGTPGGPTFTKLDQNGGTNYPGTDSTGKWEVEEALDVEWAHVIAPLANIVLVEASSFIYSSSLLPAFDTARNLAGVSVVSMSFCGKENISDPVYNTHFTTPPGHQGVTFLASSGDAGSPGGYPAYSPNVLAVGGTSLTLSGNSYGSETGWSGSGGGVSQLASQPSYQQGLVIHNGASIVDPGGMRTIPDVAFDADPYTGVAIYDSYNGGSSPWSQYGGTSLAAPCWAGLIAIANQIRVSAGLTTLDGPTQTLPRLYSLPAADFHDITSGTSTGSPNYTAAAGYDLVTGLGSPVANLLVPALAGVVTLSPASLPASTVNLAYHQTITASGGAGSTTLTVSNIQNPIAGLNLPASGINSLTISGTPTAAGTETFTVTATDTLGDTTLTNYSITINNIANPPVLAGIESGALSYTEGNPATTITASITASDTESATLAAATVWISGNYQSSEDVLSFVNTANITGNWNATTGTLTLSGSDTLANYQAALRAVTYVDTSLSPSSATRTLSFKVNDGLADSNVVTRQVTVTPLNNPPVLAGIESGAFAYTEGNPATAVTTSITTSDVDNTTLAWATVWISSNYQSGEDVLSFANTANITGTWNATTGTLTLSGSDTLANYQAALRAVKYVDTSLNPSSATRTVSFKVNDGQADSNVLTRQVTVTPVNNPPVLAGIESGALAYSEGNPATAVTASITASDVDNTTLAGATVWISGNYQSGQDVLSFSNTANITGTWNATTGTLTLSGSDTLANYQAALRAVKYVDTSLNPSNATRTVSFKVNDGQADSNVLTRQVTVTPVNNPPVLAGIESGALAYSEGNPATAVTASITTSDVDNTTLAGATVWISGNYQSGEDVLSFANTANITGTWNATTGTLTLSGSDTLANYQAALRAVKYVDTSLNPSSATRTVSFKVNDGQADSNVLTRQVTVTPLNNPPVLAGIESGTLAYTEGNPATAVTASITTSDVDNTALAGAAVWISGNYQSGEDVLSFANTANITGTWSATTGTLTLSGSDTLANYQAALRAVKYVDTSLNPSNATRTLSFKVNDGQADSNVLTRQVTVTPVNNSPALAGIESGALVYTEGNAATAVTASITTSDVDNTTLAGATVWISVNYRSGEDVLSFVNTGSITGNWSATTGTLTLSGSDTLANYQAALRAVKYVDTSLNPSSATRTVSFKVNDGQADSNIVTRQITVTQQGPTLSPATLAAVTVNVAYNQTLTTSGGTGSITLTVTNIQNAIAGLVVPASGSGSLTISGTPTAAGTETFMVTATDSLGATTSTNYSITVNAAVALGPATLPADTVNVAYNQTLTASGGTGTKNLTVTSIKHAIAGLIVPASGSGSLTISGTPTATGTETFTVTATDTLGATTSTNYSITVNAAVSLGPSSLPADTVNVAYNQTITASGGTGSIALLVSNIQNPIAGLVVPASGSGSLTISGTPTAAGTETFTVIATDTLGATTTTNYSITVNAAVAVGPKNLPPHTAKNAYSQTLTASGGTGTDTLTVSNIQNPIAGLTVPSSGSGSLTISGTPTAAGTETFTVTATDTLGATTSISYSVTVNPAVTLSPASLPADTVNVAYNQTLTTSGGTGTKTLMVTNIQNAIAGLVVPASGSGSLTISGTPTATGTETFTVTATDTLGATASTIYSITVNRAPPPGNLGVSSAGYWYLDVNGDNQWTAADGVKSFGPAGATPVTGDWDGSGHTELGCFLNGTWWLATSSGIQTFSFGFGGSNVFPVAGDWNGDGKSEVGVYCNGAWFRDVDGSHTWDATNQANVAYVGWNDNGTNTVIPVPGDWAGSGKTQMGVYCQGVWFLDSTGSGQWDGNHCYWGWSGSLIPVVGNWSHSGTKDQFGVYSQGAWFRDYDGTHAWDAANQAALAYLGWSGAQPVVGNWAGSVRAGNAAAGAVMPSPAAVMLTAAPRKPAAVVQTASAPPQTLSSAANPPAVATSGTVESDASGITSAMAGRFAPASLSGGVPLLDPNAVDRLDLAGIAEHRFDLVAGALD